MPELNGKWFMGLRNPGLLCNVNCILQVIAHLGAPFLNAIDPDHGIGKKVAKAMETMKRKGYEPADSTRVESVAGNFSSVFKDHRDRDTGVDACDVYAMFFDAMPDLITGKLDKSLRDCSLMFKGKPIVEKWCSHCGPIAANINEPEKIIQMKHLGNQSEFFGIEDYLSILMSEHTVKEQPDDRYIQHQDGCLNKGKEHSERTTYTRLPQILAININRFVDTNDQIRFRSPMPYDDDLDLDDNTGTTHHYNLMATINHVENVGGINHYVAYIKTDPNKMQWVECDGTDFRKTTACTVEGKPENKPQLLFYVSQTPMATSGNTSSSSSPASSSSATTLGSPSTPTQRTRTSSPQTPPRLSFTPPEMIVTPPTPPANELSPGFLERRAIPFKERKDRLSLISEVSDYNSTPSPSPPSFTHWPPVSPSYYVSTSPGSPGSPVRASPASSAAPPAYFRHWAASPTPSSASTSPVSLASPSILTGWVPPPQLMQTSSSPTASPSSSLTGLQSPSLTGQEASLTGHSSLMGWQCRDCGRRNDNEEWDEATKLRILGNPALMAELIARHASSQRPPKTSKSATAVLREPPSALGSAAAGVGTTTPMTLRKRKEKDPPPPKNTRKRKASDSDQTNPPSKRGPASSGDTSTTSPASTTPEKVIDTPVINLREWASCTTADTTGAGVLVVTGVDSTGTRHSYDLEPLPFISSHNKRRHIKKVKATDGTMIMLVGGSAAGRPYGSPYGIPLKRAPPRDKTTN